MPKHWHVDCALERDDALRALEFVVSVSDGETEAFAAVPLGALWELQTMSPAAVLRRLCLWLGAKMMSREKIAVRRVGDIPDLDLASSRDDEPSGVPLGKGQ